MDNILEKYYSSNEEWYHTRQHIEELLFMWDFYKKFFVNEFKDIDEKALVETIYYHDSVYIPGSKTNEEDSVNVYLQEGGIDKKVIDCILSTKVGNVCFQNEVEKIMHDLDWSGFRDYVTMLRNEKNILREAVEKGGYKENEALNCQIEFYKSIYEKEIYVTETFKKFNKLVKTNIKRRLKDLCPNYGEQDE